LAFNLAEVQSHLGILSLHNVDDKNTIEFYIGKLQAQFQYLQYEEVEVNAMGFLNETIGKLYAIGNRLDSEFFGI
jgi:hypothetical protein